MAIYAISDLHLALGVDKPMDIFGAKWSDYMERIKTNWINLVDDKDTVIIPGDISWATYIEQAYRDFEFIEKLPGKKIISKGNHDYWWTTSSKLVKYLKENNLDSISFMHNNSFLVENVTLCGTRGWKCPGDEGFNQEDMKIYLRELQRLELSLKSAKDGGDIIVAMHYPPFNAKKEPSGFIEVMEEYKVTYCLYGHLHGEGFKNAVIGDFGNIKYRLVSADFLDFSPIRVV